jgi:hypothetical protein
LIGGNPALQKYVKTPTDEEKKELVKKLNQVLFHHCNTAGTPLLHHCNITVTPR